MNRKYLAPLLTAIILVLAVFLGIELVRTGPAEDVQQPIASQTQAEGTTPPESTVDVLPAETAADTEATEALPPETTAPAAETQPAPQETTPAKDKEDASNEESTEETEVSLPPNMLPIG